MSKVPKSTFVFFEYTYPSGFNVVGISEHTDILFPKMNDETLAHLHEYHKNNYEVVASNLKIGETLGGKIGLDIL